MRSGLFAASALLVDYVLTVAVGISAGVGALVSAVPSLHPYMVSLCLGILFLVALVNLRGVRESGLAFALPTYVFVAALGGAILFGVVKAVMAGGHPVPVESPAPLSPAIATASLWLLMRSFASGCTAMTGVEAVSNGVGAFARPTVKYAIGTLSWIVAILALMLAGIAYLCHAYSIGATDRSAQLSERDLSARGGDCGARVVLLRDDRERSGRACPSANMASPIFSALPAPGKGRVSRGHLRSVVGGLSFAWDHYSYRAVGVLLWHWWCYRSADPLSAVGAFGIYDVAGGNGRGWLKVGGTKARTSMIINGIGAVSTGIALCVVLAAKFAEGAWITILLIPGFVLLFEAVNRHYRHVAKDTDCKRPIPVAPEIPPLVIVPLKSWNTISEKAIRFAMGLSPDVIAAHVGVTEQEIYDLKRDWERFVEGPLKNAGRKPPKLIAVSSPYRRLFTPLIGLVRDLKEEHPGRRIAVIIPELVETRWWQHILHNQRAAGLKAALLFRGDKNIVVINVPWYLGEG